MSKAILMAIQPKYCELIASGKKTMEVRKTIPKLEPPFKCYVYETRGKPVRYSDIAWEFEGKGKVIGEFVCDYIIGHCEMANADIAEQRGCIKREQLFEYAKGKELYAWHISDLVIYDALKELSEFYVTDNSAIQSCKHREIIGQPEYKTAHNGWIKGSYICNANGERDWCTKCRVKPITRPPQSWCYVEELSGA